MHQGECITPVVLSLCTWGCTCVGIQETVLKYKKQTIKHHTVRVENFEVVLISRFSWVADDTKIIHVEGGINTREIF